VKDCVLSCRRLHHCRADQLVHRLLVHSSRALAAWAAPAAALPAGPAGLGDAAHQLSVAPTDEEGCHLQLHLAGLQVQVEYDVRALEIELLFGELSQPLSNFAIQLRLEGLGVLRSSVCQQQLLVLREQAGHPRSHQECLVLDAGEGSRRPIRPAIELCRGHHPQADCAACILFSASR